MGIRSATDLALPAFLASSHECAPIVSNVTYGYTVSYHEEAVRLWDTKYSKSPAEEQVKTQKGWDKIAYQASHSTLLSTCENELDAIRLRAVSSEHAGSWLDAFPAETMGTCLPDEEFRAAVGLRLGMRSFQMERCICGDVIDEFGHHKLSCSKTAGLTEGRHDAINDVLARAFRQAGCHVTVEPSGLHRDDRKRPDGLTSRNWTQNKPLVWDVTVADTYAQGYRRFAREGVGLVIHQREMHKRRLYGELMQDYTFMPIGLESSGVWGKDALKLTKELGQKLFEATGERRSTAFLRQRISMELQRGNARMMLAYNRPTASTEDLF